VSSADLNSVHLDASRLETYRKAREKLLGACGDHTLNLSGEMLQEKLQKLCRVNPVDSSADPVTPPRHELPFVFVNKHQKISLKVGHNTIGRLPDNDIVASDGFLSRRHCALLVHSDLTCELHDLASKNGTFLNGIRIKEPTPLQPGDEIKLGDLRIGYMAPPSDAQRQEAAAPDHTCVLQDSHPA
jgi:hypothetical protein